VLRGLTLAVAPRSKLALCGRTGCGKSSLFGALRSSGRALAMALRRLRIAPLQ
jgi:ABC-type transport system involved in cytochrome bd biosynthesis fused ATPase/permease subunit